MGLSKVRFKAEVDFDGRVVTRSYLEKQDIDQILNVSIHIILYVCSKTCYHFSPFFPFEVKQTDESKLQIMKLLPLKRIEFLHPCKSISLEEKNCSLDLFSLFIGSSHDGQYLFIYFEYVVRIHTHTAILKKNAWKWKISGSEPVFSHSSVDWRLPSNSHLHDYHDYY